MKLADPWYPIENAPIGTPVLVCDEFCMTVAVHAKAKWREAWTNKVIAGMTHWRPLPNPPTPTPRDRSE